jgi:hypothetical protein
MEKKLVYGVFLEVITSYICVFFISHVQLFDFKKVGRQKKHHKMVVE